MRQIGYGVLTVLLMASAVWGQSQSDIVGAWSSIFNQEGAIVIVMLTIGEDFTYKMEVKIGQFLLPVEEGTYELSGNRIVATAEEETYEITILSFSEDRLVLSMEDQVLTFVRGMIEDIQLGGGSISGTIGYSGSIEEQQSILVMAFSEDKADFEDLSSLYITSIPEVGPYTITGLPDGAYYVVAFIADTEIMLEEEWDPTVIGAYGTFLVPESVEIADEAAITGIDIELVDISEVAVAPQSWAQVKAAFR